MSSYRIPAKRSRSLKLTVLAPALALIALMSWGLASPVGSTPDDDFHMASIWCSASAINGGCSEGTSTDTRMIPAALTSDAVCYVRDSRASASCQGSALDNTDMKGATDRGNFDGLYPEVFYWVMGLLAGPNITVSVLAMRLLNSILLVGLVGSLAALLAPRHRTSLLVSVAITLVPLGFFLVPSTNPSSWSIISAAVLLYALIGYFEAEGRRKIALAIVATAATVIGAGARADAAVYAGIAIVAAIILTLRLDRRYLVSAALPCALALTAVGFYLSSSQGGEAAAGGIAGGSPGDHPGVLIWVNGLNVPELWAGAFGSYPLGWFDTTLPSIVWVFSFAAFAAMCFIGLGLHHRGKVIAALFVGVVLYFFPFYLLVQGGAFVGEYVQPRYTLPLLTMLAAILLVRNNKDEWSMARPQTMTIAIALTAANSVALHTNIRRYVTGSDVTGWNLDRAAEWWWNIPFSPMFVWIIGSAAFGILLLVIGTLMTPRKLPDVASPLYAPAALT